MSSHDESEEHEEEEEVEAEVEEDEQEQEEEHQQDEGEEEQEEEEEEEEEEGHNQTPANHDEEEEEEQQEEEEEEEEQRDEVDPTNPLDEDSVEAAQNLTQEDVFGEDLSDSSDEEGAKRKQHDGSMNESHEVDEELAEEQEEEEPIFADTPHVECDLGREIHLVKLPNFMKIDPKPFDPEHFHEDVRDDDDEESKARLKLQVENTIRWRYVPNGQDELVRESNTRLVRWSDGSFSLHVGKEIFDVSRTNIQNDHNHLFVRHQKSMQAQAVFRTKLALRQHSNDSLAHLKLKFASKANPAPKVRVLSNIKAPMLNSVELKRREEQRIRTEERRRNQQLRQREQAAYRSQNVSASFLEDRDADDEKESLNTIKENAKKKRLQNRYRQEETSDEDEDEEDEDILDQRSSTRRSTTSIKHRKVTASDDEEQSDGDQDDQQSKRKRVQSEDDEDDE